MIEGIDIGIGIGMGIGMCIGICIGIGKPHDVGPSETWDAGCWFAVPKAPDCGCLSQTSPSHRMGTLKGVPRKTYF